MSDFHYMEEVKDLLEKAQVNGYADILQLTWVVGFQKKENLAVNAQCVKNDIVSR